MLSVTVQGHRRCLILKKKNAETVWEKNTDEATNLHFDCAKHRTIKRDIYIQQTILCKHGKYVSFQKT